MSLFNESTVSGEVHTYRRATKLELHNGAIPEARCFVVDRITYPNGEVVEKFVGQLDYQLTNLNETIPVIDPETFEPTEQTFTAGEYHLMSASVALWMMRK